jgi:nitrous oxide reductase accessory protein NosL
MIQAVLAATLSVAAGCDRTELAGPPDLRLGRDQCHECGMLINEDRCSSAILIQIHGVREHIAFDDIGCMLDYERDIEPDVQIVSRFVSDHEDRVWIESDKAWFLTAEHEKVPTPMGSGMVAFVERASAEHAQRDWGGEVMRYQDLVQSRVTARAEP